ncbi:ABC transporter permease [Pseudomonas taiwanensis]|uniref:ABC transporter permease n=1 Tax=Pseudomonas taiwanensis TaxID=470150 RepID=UPI000403335A|nr:ABC transporter permease [Pseudomonas taiwanensis]
MSMIQPSTPKSPKAVQTRSFLLTLPALALFICVMIAPLAIIVLRSFTEPALGLQNYQWFFSGDVNITILARTFNTAFWVTLCCVITAYPFAFAMSVVGPRLRTLMMLCVMVPFLVSGVIRTFAWVILLQDSGLINHALMSLGFDKLRLIRTQLGVNIGMTQILLPFMVMPLYSVMRSIDMRLLQAASSLGGSPIGIFFQVYLPLSLPGVAAGALTVFILALGFYITPLLLGGPASTLLSTLIQQQVLSLLNWGRGGAMGVVLLVATMALLVVVAPLLKRKYDATGGSK